MVSKQEGRDNSHLAWLVVLVSFFSTFVVDALGYSLPFINQNIQEIYAFDNNAASFITSVYWSLPLLISPVSRFVVQYFGTRTSLFIAGFLSASSLLISTTFSSLITFIIFLGVIPGVCFSLVMMCTQVAIFNNFRSKRGIASGIAFLGNGISSFFAGKAEETINKHSSVHLIRILALMFFSFALLSPFLKTYEFVSEDKEKKEIKKKLEKRSQSLTSLQRHNEEVIIFRKSKKRCRAQTFPPMSFSSSIFPFEESSDSGRIKVDFFPAEMTDNVCKNTNFFQKHFKFLSLSPKLCIYALCSFLVYFAGNSPYMYSYQRIISTGISDSAAFFAYYLALGIVIGHVTFGYASDKLSKMTSTSSAPIFLYAFSMACFSASTFCVPFIFSLSLTKCYAFGLGFFTSASYVLDAIITLDIVSSSKKFTAAFSLVLFSQGLGSICAAFPSGLLIDKFETYDYTFYLSASFSLLSAIFASSIWISSLRKQHVDKKAEN